MEEKYPQIAHLKPGEIFVEWVYVLRKWKTIKKIHLIKVVKKSEVNEMKLLLQEQYGGDCIDIVTISRKPRIRSLRRKRELVS